MEEKKEKKLSYEELQKVAGELHQNYQRLMAEYRKAIDTLNSREFDYNAFFLDNLFKVVKHADKFEPEFVKWTVGNITSALVSFHEAMSKAVEEETEEPAKDEA